MIDSLVFLVAGLFLLVLLGVLATTADVCYEAAVARVAACLGGGSVAFLEVTVAVPAALFPACFLDSENVTCLRTTGAALLVLSYPPPVMLVPGFKRYFIGCPWRFLVGAAFVARVDAIFLSVLSAKYFRGALFRFSLSTAAMYSLRLCTLHQDLSNCT